MEHHQKRRAKLDDKVIKKLLQTANRRNHNPGKLGRCVIAVITVPKTKFIIKLRYLGNITTGVANNEIAVKQRATEVLLTILRHL